MIVEWIEARLREDISCCADEEGRKRVLLQFFGEVGTMLGKLAASLELTGMKPHDIQQLVLKTTEDGRAQFIASYTMRREFGL